MQSNHTICILQFLTGKFHPIGRHPMSESCIGTTCTRNVMIRCIEELNINPFFICRDNGSILGTPTKEDLPLVLEEAGSSGSHGGTWCILAI